MLYLIVSCAVVVGGAIGVFFALTKKDKPPKDEPDVPYKVDKEAPVDEVKPSETKPSEETQPTEQESGKEEVVPPVVEEKPKEKVTITLNAVRKEKGSSQVGLETNEEIKARLASLSMEEFKALDIPDDKPWSEDDWNNPANVDQIDLRSSVEIRTLYMVNYKGEIIEEHKDILTRTFEV